MPKVRILQPSPSGGLWHQWFCLHLFLYTRSSSSCSHKVLEKTSPNSFSCLWCYVVCRPPPAAYLVTHILYKYTPPAAKVTISPSPSLSDVSLHPWTYKAASSLGSLGSAEARVIRFSCNLMTGQHHCWARAHHHQRVSGLFLCTLLRKPAKTAASPGCLCQLLSVTHLCHTHMSKSPEGHNSAGSPSKRPARHVSLKIQ